ncbi:MAG: ABC transporter substrate-binding protein [Desulfobacterales bacterium]|jgi:putative spermidine/putrescine transport system substrate-binding protein
MERPNILKKFRLERIGLFAIVTFFVFTGSLQAEPIAGKPPLTVVSRGGAYTKSQMLAFVNPYREMKNRWVNVEDHNGGLAQIRKQVGSLNVKWDVVNIEIGDSIRACKEGLLEKIDHAVLGRSAVDDFYPEALEDCAVGQTIGATVIAYNPDHLSSAKPSKVADFFDLERFPGARGLRNSPVGNLEWALMADGVPVDQVYQVLSTDSGVDRAFKVLDRIKENIVWWEEGSQPLELLLNRKVVMTSAYSGRIFNAIKDRSEDLAIVWDGQVRDAEVWVIPKGTANLKEALDFIVFASDPKRMAVHAELNAYAPVRKSAMAFIDDSVRKYLPTAKENVGNALRMGYKWWTTNEQAIEIKARFEQWRVEKPWRYNFNPPDES